MRKPFEFDLARMGHLAQALQEGLCKKHWVTVPLGLTINQKEQNQNFLWGKFKYSSAVQVSNVDIILT